MPRGPREKSSSGIYHIMLRGINRQTIFEDDEDRIKFLETLKNYKDISKYQIYSYCLMDNHIHILMKEMQEPISITIKRICASYVYWYNQKYERCGHLFQERFKSEIVETDGYFLTVLRYIHQNQVKAGIIKSVSESKWTSYHEYTERATMVDSDFVLSFFSLDRQKAKDLFIEYMNENNKDQCLDEGEKVRLSDEEVREYIAKLGLVSINILQQLDRDRRDDIIRKLKKLEGVTVRQLSRVTGISKSVIDRAR